MTFKGIRMAVMSLAAGIAAAQVPPAMRQEPGASPEVRADGTVTFRLRAPNARTVSLGGEFDEKKLALTRNEEGVWSITTGPLQPDIYRYWFIVDGVNVVDPGNPTTASGLRSVWNLVSVPGGSYGFWGERPVEHGVVHRHLYRSAVMGADREFYVYTPPEYDRDPRRRFPVLYLLHGGGDTASTWLSVGKANLIMDNLLAEAKAVPMLIVMPYGQAAGPQRSPDPSSPEWVADLDARVHRVGEELTVGILPEVERRYRVDPGREHRAIAGLSMGGRQALMIGLSRLDLFASVGAFSSAVFPGDFAARFRDLPASPETANRMLKLLFLGCGSDDKFFDTFDNNRQLSDLFKSRGIRHRFFTTPGAHSFRVWRICLHEIAPLLFR
ncbi:MAG: alpha/beta fold hydrolase [Bryobacteraceae bacterium]